MRVEIQDTRYSNKISSAIINQEQSLSQLAELDGHAHL